MHVLIVDDHPLLHAVLAAVARKVLRAPRVHSVLSLEEALAYGQTSPPLDLAFLDLGLPGCSGVESVVRFRSAFPAVPVLVVSGSEEKGILEAAMQAGAKGFVPKTAPPSALESEIRALCRRVGLALHASVLPQGGDDG